MTKDETIKWLDNLIDVIGKPEHRDLWDYKQTLTELKEMIESSPEPFSVSLEQYEDALESAYAHGYTAAESEYRDKLRKCEDAVSRQAAIECLRSGQICGDFCRKAINELPPVTPKPRTGYWYITEEPFDMAIEALEKQELGKWVPCREKCPDHGGMVLVTFKSGEIGMARFVRSETIYNGIYHKTPVFRRENFWEVSEEDEDEGEVIAWRPLPEPYTAEEDK